MNSWPRDPRALLWHPKLDWEAAPLPAVPPSPSQGGFPWTRPGNGMLCGRLPGEPGPARWLPPGSTELAAAVALPPSETPQGRPGFCRTPAGWKERRNNHRENGGSLEGVLATGLAREAPSVSGEGWQGWPGDGQGWVGSPALRSWLLRTLHGRRLLPHFTDGAARGVGGGGRLKEPVTSPRSLTAPQLTSS